MAPLVGNSPQMGKAGWRGKPAECYSADVQGPERMRWGWAAGTREGATLGDCQEVALFYSL